MCSRLSFTNSTIVILRQRSRAPKRATPNEGSLHFVGKESKTGRPLSRVLCEKWDRGAIRTTTAASSSHDVIPTEAERSGGTLRSAKSAGSLAFAGS
jgi:hypothetical protein